MYYIYNILLIIFSPFILIYFLLKIRKRSGYRRYFLERLGFGLERSYDKTIWIHAVSVGEVLTASILIDRLIDKVDKRIILTTTTPSGRDVAKKLLSDKVSISYFPLDIIFIVKRVFKIHNPAIFISIDTEVWPNIIWYGFYNNIKTMIVNGRISDKSIDGYIRNGLLFRDVFSKIYMIMAQSELDAERFIKIGSVSESVFVSGNIKFDRDIVHADKNDILDLKSRLKLKHDIDIILLGSFHSGEDQAIESVIKVVREKGGYILIAPRRIENFNWIEDIATRDGIKLYYKSKLSSYDILQLPDRSILIIDSFGELAGLYKIADIALIGGSFINHGGQNPIEPISFGVPVLFGPDMSNFRDVANRLLSANGAVQVEDCSELEDIMSSLLDNKKLRDDISKATLDVLLKSKGAVNDVVDNIVRILNESNSR